MSDIAHDPISLSKALQKAGMPQDQADIIARSQQAAVEKLVEAKELATKADLKSEIAQLKVELIKWIFGMLCAFAALIIGMLKM